MLRLLKNLTYATDAEARLTESFLRIDLVRIGARVFEYKLIGIQQQVAESAKSVDDA